MTSMQVTGWLCASHDNDDLRDWHFLRWMFQRWAIKKMKCNNYHSIMQINVKKFTNWYELHFDIRPLSLLLKSSIWRTQTFKTFVFHPLSRFLSESTYFHAPLLLWLDRHVPPTELSFSFAEYYKIGYTKLRVYMATLKGSLRLHETWWSICQRPLKAWIYFCMTHHPSQ